ncbi:WXG100 family type VII secretion target [Rhodococcus artemisiae]|uniref:WXG100 family type VII secretion target n=1 Tax=Rhodococcus artemisiae TaxID=714159 RepID=A0ABU7L5J1_9NOCA|nr:hypothetical protein [Rhodococcus artemisiae]MEE2056803.1 hypothetical protein [Rhodococcus artemisiae]
MSPGVSAVEAWNPDALRTTADGLDTIVDSLDDRMKGLLNDQDVLAEQWKGDAANAAALRVVRERSLGSAIAGALLQVAGAYRTGAPIVEGARMHVVGLVRAAEHQSFTVHDNGIVDAANQISLLRALLPPGATYDTACLQLERQAAELSVALVDALQQATTAANDVTGRINNAIARLEDAASAATPGKLVKSDHGEFSWVPDWSATTASSTIGFMADSTKEGLKAAALSTGDDVARGIARSLGPAAAALGTVPAIVNDIEGGMDPAQAIVTEGAGSAVGFVTAMGGAKAGAALGTLIAPGAGTAVGIVAGALAGGAFTYLTSKSLQSIWN